MAPTLPRLSAVPLKLRHKLSKSPPRYTPRMFSSNHKPALRPQPTAATATGIATPSERPPGRIDRVISRFPRPLRKHASHLRNAPGSHVAAFLILHELTALVPLIGLVGLFHWGLPDEYVPIGWVSAHLSTQVREGMARFERYLKRKGYFGLGESGQSPESDGESAGENVEDVLQRWRHAEGGYRIVAEIALAYAITKSLLPIRIMGSLWATPWFAKVLMRIRNTFKKTRS